MALETNKETEIKVKDIIENVCLYSKSTPLKDKQYGQYVLEKSLRIASTVHRVARLLDKETAFRTSLEKSSLRLVTVTARSLTVVRARHLLEEEARVLVSILESSSLAGILAEETARIISDEILGFMRFLSERGWCEGVRYAFTLGEFDVAVPEEGVSKGHALPQQGQIKVGGYDRPSTAPTSTEGYGQKDVLYTSERDKGRTSERMQDAQKDRRATILGIMQKKDRITIKDVSNIIKDCSDKTIQRELLALVAQGVLKKEGERRWSTYRLA